jgi:hypothetical protein
MADRPEPVTGSSDLDLKNSERTVTWRSHNRIRRKESPRGSSYLRGLSCVYLRVCGEGTLSANLLVLEAFRRSGVTSWSATSRRM